LTSSYYGGEAETYYDIEINESTLSRSGFTKFCLPLNSKNRDDKSKMKLHNVDPGRIIYCDFYRSDYAKTLKSFEDQLVFSKDVDDELLDDNTISNLVVCFDNECKILRQDKDSGFFDGNGSSNNGRQQQEQQEQQEQQGEEEDERLAAENTVTAEDIKFVISTMKKEAAYDEMSIKQLFYGMDTAFTKRPTSHNINSKDSGSGKNYLLELVSSTSSSACFISLCKKILFWGVHVSKSLVGLP
jgi:hypothetical protein